MKKVFLILFLSMSVLADDTQLENKLLGLDDFDESKYLSEEDEEIDINKDNLSKYEVADPDLFNEDFPEIDFSTVKSIQQNDPEDQTRYIEKVIQSRSTRNLTFAEKEALKIKLKDIIESGTFLGAISKGTKLVHIQSGKLFYTQKDLTVRAYRKNDYEGYKLLINKNGFSSYKVFASEVNTISKITNLYEPPSHFVPTKIIKKKVKTTDTEFKLQNSYNLHLGLTTPSFISDLGGTSSHIGQTNRYEFATYGDFDFITKVGLSFQYENMYGRLSNSGKYQMSSLSIGPSFKTLPFRIGESDYIFIAQIRLATFSKITFVYPSETANFNMSQTNLALGLQREVKTFLGKIQLGGFYQRQWLRVSSQRSKADISPQNNYNDSYTFSVGFNTDHLW